MSANYRIIGADGRQYGPIAGAQVRQWIAEGRVESRTPVFTDNAKDWTFVGLLPEFAGLFPTGAPPAIAPPKPGFDTGRMTATNSFATAGMVCGIISWVCCCGFPFNLLGLVFSLIGLSQINRHPELYGGRGQAIAGLVLSILSLVVTTGYLALSLAMNPPHVLWQYGTF
ncbi:MAG TPA: DUF4190 domain-containing protein [Verrucomicrobiae bacterium]|nr:DUF4190 domain-containing protein [Verrucomicrobiae bacterium]